jgi:hypothetical protein
MHRYETRPCQTVPVQENAVAAVAHRNRAISDFREAEASIIVPDMFHRNTGALRPGRDHAAGLRARAVIGDDDLEVAVGLRRERAQDGVERIGPVVGCDNDGDQVSHAAAPKTMLSCSDSNCLPRRRPRAENPRDHRAAAQDVGAKECLRPLPATLLAAIQLLAAQHCPSPSGGATRPTAGPVAPEP